MWSERTELLVGKEGIERLRAATVAVFGLGGVGGHALEAIARAGVGHILVVDCDVVEDSNLNRQLLALGSTIGMPKVEAARRRIADINPGARVDTRHARVTSDNVGEMLDGFQGFVIDAIDSVGPKVHLLNALAQRSDPFVSCMGAAARLDPTGLRVDDLSKTHGCPLARRVRQQLRKLGVDKGIRCVFYEPTPGESPPRKGAQADAQPSISYVPGIMGLTAAGIIIRDILSERAASA